MFHSKFPPHPKIKWCNDEEPFKSNSRYLGYRNDATWKSAAIRGDTLTTLHRVTTKKGPYKAYDPEGFDVDGQRGFLLRNLPMRTLPTLPHGLAYGDSIATEANVPYRYYKSNPAPSKPKPQIYDGLKLEWIEDLGKGGFGLASLWEATFEDGVKMKVVIKAPLEVRDERNPFDDEKRWHRRYRHSKNISQSLDLRKIAESHMKDPNKKTRGSKGKYQDGNTIALEYMEHGCLNSFNRNAVYHASYGGQKRWPGNALWQLYAGLVRGLAEVAYNRHFIESEKRTFAAAFESLPNLSPGKLAEFWAKLDDAPIVHDVHFDLEEYNILVGRDSEGSVTFKLHDFSDHHSNPMSYRDWSHWNQIRYWLKREPVKPGRNLPEQHTEEWDSLAPPVQTFNPSLRQFFAGDEFGAHKPHTAGRYGMWTNIFLVAKTIECCITGYQYTHPFQTQRGYIEGEHQGASYAWRLHDDQDEVNLFPEADGQLRKIISQCMKEKPELRPTLVQLLKWVFEAQEAGKLSDNDETCDFWWAVTDPKEYRETHEQRGGKETQPKPFSMAERMVKFQVVSEREAIQEAKPGAKRFALDDSSSSVQAIGRVARPPKLSAKSQSSGPAFGLKEPLNPVYPGMQDLGLFSRSSKRARPDEGEEVRPESKRRRATKQGLQEAAKRSKKVIRDQQRVREALMPRPGAVKWQDRTGLSDALKRQLELSASAERKQPVEKKPDKVQDKEDREVKKKKDEKSRPFLLLPRLDFHGPQ